MSNPFKKVTGYVVHGVGSIISKLPAGHYLNKDPSIPDTDAQAKAEHARIDNSVDRLNSLYGIAPAGYDANGYKDGVFNANARVGAINKGAVDNTIAQEGNAAVGDGTRQLNDRMDNWLTGTRQQFSNQGLAGGSVDAAARTSAISGYLQGKSSLAEARTNAEQNARNSIEARRASGEDLIRTGGSPILDQSFNQQVADVHQANSQIPQVALGDLFKTQANIYSTQQQAMTQQAGNDTLLNSINRNGSGTYTKG